MSVCWFPHDTKLFCMHISGFDSKIMHFSRSYIFCIILTGLQRCTKKRRKLILCICHHHCVLTGTAPVVWYRQPILRILQEPRTSSIFGSQCHTRGTCLVDNEPNRTHTTYTYKMPNTYSWVWHRLPNVEVVREYK